MIKDCVTIHYEKIDLLYDNQGFLGIKELFLSLKLSHIFSAGKITNFNFDKKDYKVAIIGTDDTGVFGICSLDKEMSNTQLMKLINNTTNMEENMDNFTVKHLTYFYIDFSKGLLLYFYNKNLQNLGKVLIALIRTVFTPCEVNIEINIIPLPKDKMKDMLKDINKARVQITLADPEKIRSWSFMKGLDKADVKKIRVSFRTREIKRDFVDEIYKNINDYEDFSIMSDSEKLKATTYDLIKNTISKKRVLRLSNEVFTNNNLILAEFLKLAKDSTFYD